MMTGLLLSCVCALVLGVSYAAYAEVTSSADIVAASQSAQEQVLHGKKELVSYSADLSNLSATRKLNDTDQTEVVPVMPYPVRVVQVDLDYVYDDDAAQQKRNLDTLIDRLKDMKINTVFLQAFADPQGTGLAHALYFPNRELPMRANLFAEVVSRLKNETGVRVFGWLPVLSFDFGSSVTPIMAWDEKTNRVAVDPKAYHRASPFDPIVRTKIAQIYQDMARQAPIDGLLFHDDALMSDFEDASPAAMRTYQQAGFPYSMHALHADPVLMKKWMVFKTEALIAFTQDLAVQARLYRNSLQTVRNIYARVVLEPESQEWFAQNYDRFLHAYDYTAVMAMPRMEKVPSEQSGEWLKSIIDVASSRPDGLQHTIFELQSVDWTKTDTGQDRAVPADELGSQMRLLASEGALNFGYYPDDFKTNTPDASMLHQDFSLQTYPYRP